MHTGPGRTPSGLYHRSAPPVQISLAIFRSLSLCSPTVRLPVAGTRSHLSGGYVPQNLTLYLGQGAEYMLSLTTLALVFSAVTTAVEPVANLTDTVNTFLESLSPDQRTIAVYPFDADERWNWHFIPKERNGISLQQLEESQIPLAQAILKTALSDRGYKTAETIRSLENVLHEMEGPQATHRNPLDYHFTIFGTPAKDGTWAFRYEGHHLSLNWTIVDGKSIASSPQFLGTNPGDVTSGPLAGTRALGDLEDMGRAFIKSLTPEQQALATIGDVAPNDVFTGNQVEVAMLEDKGIAYSALTDQQKQDFIALIEVQANIQQPEVAAQRLARIQKAGLDDVKFAWMGGMEKGQGHYYRLQGKTFIVEYDNTQNNANHVHAAWRDFHGDFGRDLLKEHYAADHKH